MSIKNFDIYNFIPIYIYFLQYDYKIYGDIMKKSLFYFEIAGFIFVSAIGTLSHFLFDFFDKSKIIALFCPVNECVWEHLKLLFFPFLIWTALEYFILNKKQGNYFSSKAKGVLAGMIFIVAFFYTYTGIAGKDIAFIDILSFFAGTALSFIISYELIRNGRRDKKGDEIISICVLIAVSGIFFLFTFHPPLIPLFEDPGSFTYGI